VRLSLYGDSATRRFSPVIHQTPPPGAKRHAWKGFVELFVLISGCLPLESQLEHLRLGNSFPHESQVIKVAKATKEINLWTIVSANAAACVYKFWKLFLVSNGVQIMNISDNSTNIRPKIRNLLGHVRYADWDQKKLLPEKNLGEKNFGTMSH
jgi:hypothetical protein